MANVRSLIAGLALFAIFSTGAEAKLYKWVDENGETHYGEVIPPEYANRETQQLDKGIATKKEVGGKTKEVVKKAEPEDQATIDRKRRDDALLGTYANEQEIDLARDRNLQQIDARTNGVKMRLDTAQADLRELQKEKNGLVQAGKPAPKSLDEDISRAEAKVARLQSELTQSQNDAAALKARYEADKQRYRELKGTSAPAAPPAKQ